MKAKFNLKALFTVVLLLVAIAGQAQTFEQWQYMNRFNDVTKDIYSRAQQYYNKEVAPVMQHIKAFPAERSAEEVQKLQQDFKVAQDELHKLQYEEYNHSLRTPLEAVRVALEGNGWQKLDREVLQRFDKEWTNSSYLQFITTTEGVGFSAINDIVRKVTDLRLRGFAGSQQELGEVLQALAPMPEFAATDITVIRQRIKEKTQIIDNLSESLGEISSENEQYNELVQQRHNKVEKWYDIREELDNALLDACKYCLSAPCDKKGAYSWMRKQVEPKLDSVFHKSYRERRNRYRVVLANYDQYTTEVEDFLNLIFVYVKSGQLTEERKNEIASLLHDLDYYRLYYAGRKEPKAVSSPYLDGIIEDFEQMLNNSFEGGVEKYTELTERLWGNQQYLAQLAEEEKRIKETERIKNNGKLKETFSVNGVTFTMVKVVGGTFTMGATAEQGNDAEDHEKPAHRVTLSSYYIGQTEVTQELWQVVMGYSGSHVKHADGKDSKRPVTDASWNKCQEFINKLNQLTGMNFRLPTEAEWEFAARGGTKSRGYKYSGSNDIDVVAWYWVSGDIYGRNNSSECVATKQPNELGLYDMTGNVWEWCQDWYGENYYGSSPSSNPTGPLSGSAHVIRGGSHNSGNWNDGGARSCRVANRRRGNADYYYDLLGFRLAL